MGEPRVWNKSSVNENAADISDSLLRIAELFSFGGEVIYSAVPCISALSVSRRPARLDEVGELSVRH